MKFKVGQIVRVKKAILDNKKIRSQMLDHVEISFLKGNIKITGINSGKTFKCFGDKKCESRYFYSGTINGITNKNFCECELTDGELSHKINKLIKL